MTTVTDSVTMDPTRWALSCPGVTGRVEATPGPAWNVAVYDGKTRDLLVEGRFSDSETALAACRSMMQELSGICTERALINAKLDALTVAIVNRYTDADNCGAWIG